MRPSVLLRSPWFWLSVGLLAVLLRGLFIVTMDVDASQYASISMEMIQGGSWLQVLHRGTDYLDKPPLLFWVSALSMRTFGLYTWAYKLPSLLAALAGVYAVYRFSKLYYPEKTALQAALLLASCIGLIVMCNDVRTDTLLMGASACAVWQLAEYLQFKRWKNLVFGFAGIGLAMLAKGPIGLVMPAFAVGSQLLLQRDWWGIFRWQWLAGLAVTAIMLVPMCWGLYEQFDLHPEKFVNDHTGVSGLRFYFWEQSFGRITGENVWKNDTTAFYFLHVYLWAFLPWTFLLVGALWQRARNWRSLWNPAPGDEVLSLGGFVLTFVALSLSKYKLPHYIFITLPWAAVLTARFLNSLPALTKSVWLALYGPAAVALCTAFLIAGFIFPTTDPLVWVVLLGLCAGLLWRVFRDPFPSDSAVLVQRGVWAILIAAFALNFHFYPNLEPYQSTSVAMQWAHEHNIPKERIAFFHRHGHALDFYNGDLLEKMGSPEDLRRHAAQIGSFWVYTDLEGKEMVENAGIPFQISASFQHFQIALLKIGFLNPATREQYLQPVYLLQILPEKTN